VNDICLELLDMSGCAFSKHGEGEKFEKVKLSQYKPEQAPRAAGGCGWLVY
jgi:hypothetical protein